MSIMTIHIATEAEGVTASHQAGSVRFSSTERRMPGAPDAPSPLELLVASLTGCMNVVAWMVASERKLPLRQLTFEAKAELDPRGIMGDPSVPSRVEAVDLTVTVRGALDAAAVEELRREVERRCPVHNTLAHSGIRLTETWVPEA